MAESGNADLETTEFLEADEVLKEYRRVKLLLELVRRPDVAKLLEDIGGYPSVLKGHRVKRMSRL